MVRTTGLRIAGRPGHEIWLCERERESYHLDELHEASRRPPVHTQLGSDHSD
jgi:hypothetical protein